MKESKRCAKEEACFHFVIQRLVDKLGRLGNENGLREIRDEEIFEKYKNRWAKEPENHWHFLFCLGFDYNKKE